MNKEERNIGSIILFIIILLVIGIGGYFAISKLGNKDDKKEEVVEIKSIKKDDSKDFVYFTNEQILSEKNELEYKDINININSEDATNLEKKLNDRTSEIKNNVTKISEANIDTTDIIMNDDIYEAENKKLANPNLTESERSEQGKKAYQAFMRLRHNIPSGFEMWETITTNYLQLKTICIQRANHKQREDWNNFLRACFSMPRFSELTGLDEGTLKIQDII